MKNRLAIVVLAAGEGTRMKSYTPKVLHKVCGKPMLEYVVDAALSMKPEKVIVVVGTNAEQVMKVLPKKVIYAHQRRRLGTGHAVKQTEKLLAGFKGDVIVINGDTPLIKKDTLCMLLDLHHRRSNASTILTTQMANPMGYGRIIRQDGYVVGIVEQKDADERQRSIREVNTGTYCFDCGELFKALKNVKKENRQGEYYLTDVISIFSSRGRPIGSVVAEDPNEVMGINTRVQLAQAEKSIRMDILEKLMLDGVTIIDPETTHVDESVRIGRDSVIHPFTIIKGDTKIQANSSVGPFVYIKDGRIMKSAGIN